MTYFKNIIIKNFKNITLYFVIIVAISSGAESCNKEKTKPCLNGGYAFKATAQFSPEQETYHIGDTIFLSSEIDKVLQDQINPSITIDYSGSVGIKNSITIASLDTNAHKTIDAGQAFAIVSLIGNAVPTATAPVKGYTMQYQESIKYILKIGFVPRAVGLFQFAVLKASSKGLPGKNCTNAAFATSVSNPNKHQHFFTYTLGYPPDADHLNNTYFFRIVP